MTKYTKYNNTYNEGGEGYNPYNRRTPAQTGEPEWSKLSGKIDRLLKRLESVSTEDSDYDAIEAEIATLRITYFAALKEGK